MPGKVTDPELLKLLEQPAPSKVADPDILRLLEEEPQKPKTTLEKWTSPRELGRAVAGIPEALASMGSGVVSYPLGLVAGAGEYARAKLGIGRQSEVLEATDPEAEAWRRAGEARRKVQEAFTYSPRSEVGRESAEAGAATMGKLMRPLTWAGEKAGEAATYIPNWDLSPQTESQKQRTRDLYGEVVPSAIAALVTKGAKPGLSKLETALEKRAVESGRKALSGIGTPLSARAEVPAPVVNQAIDTGAIRPLGTTTGAAERLALQADELGARYAQILRDLEAKGVRGPDAEALAQKLLAEARAAEATSLGSVRPGMLRSAADELPTKLGPVTDNRLGLGQAEEIKRGLQSEARREYDKITRQTTTAGETKKEIAGVMRQAIEDEVAAQASKAPAEAAAFMPVKNRLANTLSGLRVAEEGAARAARRAPPSMVIPTAVGAATGNIGAAALPLLARLGDRRVASTLAYAARKGSKGASRLEKLLTASRQDPATAAALAAALKELKPGELPRLTLGLTPAAADEESR